MSEWPWWLVLFACLASVVAEASEPPGKAEFDRANRYFEADAFDAALPYYEQAYELSGGRASVVLALAQCERALGLYDRALGHFREYLATGPDDAARIDSTILMLEEARAIRRDEPIEAAPEAVRSAPVQRAELPVMTSSAASTIVEAKPGDENDASESFFETPYFWGVAAVLAIVGGAAVFAAAQSPREPYGGNSGLIFPL